MKFNLVFENTNDIIPFEVQHNHKLIEWVITRAQQTENNCFGDNREIHTSCNQLLNELHWSLSKTNEVLWALYGTIFPQCNVLTDYLDQKFLNRQHELWVKSQFHEIDIDQMRYSTHKEINKIGNQLHNLYQDDIRKIKLAEAMTKLGFIHAYEEVNLTVHRLEAFFSRKIEFSADRKWEVFDNPYVDNFESNNNVVNFSFGYTYVGRQYYDKWKYFDTDLDCSDYYNYEQLEWSFHINLDRPETVPYSKEFIQWCQLHNVRPLTTQIPIANVVDLDKNLHYYRTLLYKNSQQNNRASLTLT